MKNPEVVGVFMKNYFVFFVATNISKFFFAVEIFRSTFQLSYEQEKFLKRFLTKSFVDSENYLVQLTIQLIHLAPKGFYHARKLKV